SCSCPEAPRREASRRRDWVGRHGLVVTFGAWPASLQARARPPAFSLLLADDENSLLRLKADSECNSHNPNYVLAQPAKRLELAPSDSRGKPCSRPPPADCPRRLRSDPQG